MVMVSIAIVNWNSKKYLEKCINSILNQTYKEFEIIFIDNDSHDGSYDFVVEKFGNESKVRPIQTGSNLGYAAGSNVGINNAHGEYVMIMNPDVILEADFVEKCVEFMNSKPECGCLSGKLLRYDFDNDKKLETIDSCGIIMNSSRQAADRGQNEIDKGQYNKTEQIFGVCGAAAFFSKNILDKIKITDEYFDEDFFAYKEDIDICWRINLYGYKCFYYPEAVAYHARGVKSSDTSGFFKILEHRRSLSKFILGISTRNHLWMLLKNEVLPRDNKMRVFYRGFKLLVFFILFERFQIKHIIDAYKKKCKMLRKRREILKNLKITKKDFDKLITDF